MIATRAWMTSALICNLLGGTLLFLSFQIAPSNFRLVRGSDASASVCMDGRAVIISKAGTVFLGGIPCPEWNSGKPTAEIHVERPLFVYLGFGLTILGFALQCLFVWTRPPELAHWRAPEGRANQTTASEAESEE